MRRVGSHCRFFVTVRRFTLCAGAFAVALLVFGSGPVHAQAVSPASPLQPSHYIPGLAGIRDAVTPPPGLFVIWYNYGFISNRFIDRNGNVVDSLRQGNVAVDLDVSMWATSPLIAFSSRRAVLGGARYIVGIAPNFFQSSCKLVTQRYAGIDDTTITQVSEGSLGGWSDLVVVPLGLSWAFGRFSEDASNPFAGLSDEEIFEQYGLPPPRHWNVSFFYWFAAPTGRYETGASDNLGFGFWTHAFQLFGYWYPRSDQAAALEAGLTFETHSRIKDRDVRPGDRLSLEYGASMFVNPWLELGIGGAHNWQISDDTGDDVYWDPNVHDRKSMLNFTVGALPTPWLYVVGKYGFDYGARQRFDGHNFVLNLTFITGWLDGR